MAIAICGGLLFVALSAYSKYQMSKIPDLSFQEALEYTTKDNADAVITVGIIKDGNTSYTVYGENGVIGHNGGTGNYNSYLGFSIDKNVAVIILSNLAPNYRIPATVLGVKLLDELE